MTTPWPTLLPIHAASLSLSLTWWGLVATLVPLVGASDYRFSASALGAGYLAELCGLLGIGLVIDWIGREGSLPRGRD